MIWRKYMPITSDTLDSWDEFDDDEHGSLDDFEEEDEWEEDNDDWYWDGEEL
jgi:hypothetical protein